MGVKGLWQLLREHSPDFHDKPYGPIPASKIRVDVGGSLSTTIRYTCSNTHSKINNAYRRLEHQLIKLSKKDQLVLYVDGHPAAEKAITHRQREQNRHKARDCVCKALATLQDHLQTNRRIRKHHIMTANKELRSAFNWTMDDRRAFVDCMANEGYEIILCATEADVKIAVNCKEEDVVVMGDSDLLIYKSVPAVWRPRGRAKSQRYSLYDKAAVLDSLDVASTRLVALVILSGNDYTGNIPSLGIETNRKLIKKLGDGALPEVIRKRDKDHINDWTCSSFDGALKVFVSMKQDRVGKTDGHRLQVQAFKLRELLSVRYKRYNSDLLPDRLLFTTVGTDDHLAEVRNVFKSNADVKRLLGCTADEVVSISYLGIDLGHTCVVGAYAYLTPDKESKVGRNRLRGRRKRVIRGRDPRGGKRNKVKIDSRTENEAQKAKNLKKTSTQPARSSATSSESWSEAEKLSISKIETTLPPQFQEAQMARSFGYLVLGVNEYYMSKKCPKREMFVSLSISIRRSYCRNREKYIHRDGMDGYNMVNVLRAYVERQEGPDYLNPVDEDGNHPWKDDYKCKAQPTWASGASTWAASKPDCDRKRPAKEVGNRSGRPAKKRMTAVAGTATDIAE
ncbi:hypothetical protein BGZ98_009332 [Dissophora globulifera]|nr:hypothetical protein BGZ98_009332 [Dissophora globulifera]